MKRLVVSDTTCLIALERVGRLDLIPALFEAYAPPAVVDEFGHTPEWLTVRPAPDQGHVEDLTRTLDRGESEAIVLALSIPGASVLIDEAKGRAAAARRGLSVIGTAGLLVEAKRQGVITDVRPLLLELVAKRGFYLSATLLRTILREAGED